MAITLDKTLGTNSNIATTTTTIALTVPAGGVAIGKTLIVSAGGYVGGSDTAVVVTDSKSNSWTLLGHFFDSGAGNVVSVWICRITVALVAGDTITATAGVGLQGLFFDATQWTSTASLALDLSTSNRTTGTALSSGAITTTHPSELLYSVAAVGSGGLTYTPGTGWTLLNTIDNGSGTDMQITQEQLVTSTSSYTSTGTLGSAHGVTTMIFGLYESATAPTNTVAPAITGSTVAPATLTATSGTWTG